MQKSLWIIAAGAMLVAAPLSAAEYNCANKDTTKKLIDYDIAIKKREAGVAEMHDEITQGGGVTEQQKKALATFEEKLAKSKSEREVLLKECGAS